MVDALENFLTDLNGDCFIKGQSGEEETYHTAERVIVRDDWPGHDGLVHSQHA